MKWKPSFLRESSGSFGDSQTMERNLRRREFLLFGIHQTFFFFFFFS